MAITSGDCTDGTRTGLAGRIANAIVAAAPGGFAVTYLAGKAWTAGLNALVQGIVDGLNNDKIDLVSQVVTGSDAAWTAVTFAGTFANYSSPTWVPAQYRKYVLGAGISLLHLVGLVTGGAGGGTITTMPAGLRPLNGHQFAQHQFNGVATNSYAETTVNPNGTVVANVYVPAAGGNMSIDCIYLAEQ